MFLTAAGLKIHRRSLFWTLSATGWLGMAFAADKLFSAVTDHLTSIDSIAFQLALYVTCSLIIIAPACLLWVVILFCEPGRGRGSCIFYGLFANTLVGLCVTIAMPHVRTALAYADLAMHGDEFADAEIFRQGDEIRFNGLIGYGASRRVAALLDENPATSRIVIDSRGGRMGPAIAIAKIIKAHNLEVHVPSTCESACTLLFIASPHRSLGPEAQLGFHAFHLSSGTQAENAAVNSFFAKQWRALVAPGIDTGFLAGAYSRPADTLWKPERALMKTAGLL